MAIKRSDKSGYKDPKAFSMQFNEVTKSKDFRVLSATSIAGAAAITACVSLFNVVGDAPTPAVDHDLYTGLFNETRNYTFFDWERSGTIQGYMAIRNDEGYAIYQNMDVETRLKFVEDRDEALRLAEMTIERLQQERATLSEEAYEGDIFAEGVTRSVACDEFSRPFNFNGGIERHILPEQNGCELISASYNDVLEENANALAFWQEARLAILDEQSHYGIDASNLTTPEPYSIVQEIAGNSAGVAGGMAALWLLGAAGAAGNRRRKLMAQMKP
jgi:hypothetical protein